MRQLQILVNTPVEAADDDLALAIDDQNRGNHGSRARSLTTSVSDGGLLGSVLGVCMF